jgi:sialidase-1
MNHETLTQTLLESGEDGEFDVFRRPGVIRGPGDVLIAYYEGQILGKEARQTLFYRISRDNGKNWSGRAELASGGGGELFLHNIMMVPDQNVIHCFWNANYRRLFHCVSKDGTNWSKPEEITRLLLEAKTRYRWNAFGIGSGHGVAHSGGIALLPTWFTTGGDSHKPSAFANIYSDDGFRTLMIGSMLESSDQLPNPNEGAVAELSGGEVLATVRHDGARRRAFARSAFGVEPWQDVVLREDLPDPICHASLLRLGGELGSERMLLCNCANPDEGAAERKASGLARYAWSDDARKRLTVRLSQDGGRSFREQAVIADKGGYSDMAVCGDGRSIVCVYETGWQDSCIFPKQLGVALVDTHRLSAG